MGSVESNKNDEIDLIEILFILIKNKFKLLILGFFSFLLIFIYNTNKKQFINANIVIYPNDLASSKLNKINKNRRTLLTGEGLARDYAKNLIIKKIITLEDNKINLSNELSSQLLHEKSLINSFLNNLKIEEKYREISFQESLVSVKKTFMYDDKDLFQPTVNITSMSTPTGLGQITLKTKIYDNKKYNTDLERKNFYNKIIKKIHLLNTQTIKDEITSTYGFQKDEISNINIIKFNPYLTKYSYENRILGYILFPISTCTVFSLILIINNALNKKTKEY